ncbi:MAG: alpha/beta fold hydrolase [Steroidobacteraceae bacterium]|nr:alpha/beta fold hydrolase [Steroidobacteraceae bacterium]
MTVAGCVTSESTPPPPPPPIDEPATSGGEEPEHAVVRVLFATDRNRTAALQPASMFGGKRADLTYGTCDVSIPREHRMGVLESPSLLRLEFREDPEKHVVLLGVETLRREQFAARLDERLRSAKKRSAFVFVHGYNVSFEDAARRTAQISYDLGFPGVPMFYSWPSQASTALYVEDEQNVEWAETNLHSFLGDVLTKSGDAEIVLIAHSMGNRALTRVIATLSRESPALRSRIKEIILTAPDIDADVFRRQLGPALIATGRPITLYASSNDLALVASKQAHGYGRAGESGPGLIVLPGIETIDATGVDTGLLGHSYYGDSRSVLADMFHLLREGKRASERAGLKPIDGANGRRHWTIAP